MVSQSLPGLIRVGAGHYSSVERFTLGWEGCPRIGMHTHAQRQCCYIDPKESTSARLTAHPRQTPRVAQVKGCAQTSLPKLDRHRNLITSTFRCHQLTGLG